MEHLVGAGRAVLVDAVVTGGDPVGTVRVTTVADLPSRARDHLDSPHDVTLSGALEVGRSLGASLPEVVSVVTVEVVAVDAFSEALSPEVERAVPVAVDRVLGLVGAA